MKLKISTTLLIAALGLGTPAFVFNALAIEKGADKPADKPAKTLKIPKPYSQLSSLSDEQKTKIGEIHAAALVEIRKIEKQETTDILSQLTDEQKAELEKLKEAEAAARKAKEGAMKEGKPKDGAPKDGAPKEGAKEGAPKEGASKESAPMD